MINSPHNKELFIHVTYLKTTILLHIPLSKRTFVMNMQVTYSYTPLSLVHQQNKKVKKKERT